MTFLTYPNAPKGDYEHTHEQPLIVVIPYVILSLLALFFGYVAKDLFVGPGSDFLSTALFIHPSHITLIEAEFSLPLFYKLLPAIGSMLGAATALLLYHGAGSASTLPEFTVNLVASSERTQSKLGLSSALLMKMYTFFNGKYFFDVIYNHYIINKALGLGLVTSKVLDRGLIEKVGPFGLTESFYNTSRQMATLDTGIVTSYALYILLGFISLTLLLFVPVLAGATADNIGDLRIVLLFGFALYASSLGVRMSTAHSS